jgi:hypothetical protein
MSPESIPVEVDTTKAQPFAVRLFDCPQRRCSWLGGVSGPSYGVLRRHEAITADNPRKTGQQAEVDQMRALLQDVEGNLPNNL